MTSDAQRLISDIGRLLAGSVARGIGDSIEAIGSMGSATRCRCGCKRSECRCEDCCRKVSGPRQPSACGCEIPPPCWYPRHAGDVRSYACAEHEARLRVRVHNGAPQAATFTVECDTADGIEIDEATFQLGPMERKTVVIKLTAGEHERDHLVWVRGCYDHYIRWTVGGSCRCGDACHEIDVADAPDYLHHWYDHFYCHRPCPSHREAGLATAAHGV
jgi:hypothetical protein